MVEFLLPSMKNSQKISVVAPLFNEAQSVAILHHELLSVLKSLLCPFEIILVDDGSKDGTFEEIKKLSLIIGIRFSRNYGQTLALAAGIKKATGDVIVTIDGDLENDPKDILKMLVKLDEGYDLVSGWRKGRWQEQFFSRRLPSLVANWIISAVTGAKLHDHGCSLKVYRREILQSLKLSGEMHRMIAAYLKIFNGAKIAEMPVNYRPRRFGKSNYGPLRSFKVLLDLLAIRFFYRYANRPMHFFGGAGFFSFLLSFLFFLSMIYFKYALHITFIETPLPTLIAIFAIIGVQFILMGLLAELLLKQSSNQSLPLIKEEITN